MGAIAMAAVGSLCKGKLPKHNSKRTGPNRSFVAAVKTAPRVNFWQIDRRIAGGGHRHRPIYKIEAGDSWRRSVHRRNLFASITSLWRRSLKNGKRIVNLALAIIKPEIVRHTVTYLSGRLANAAVINLSIRSSRSLLNTFQVIFFFGVEHVRCILL
jgi:hypothetical protein